MIDALGKGKGMAREEAPIVMESTDGSSIVTTLDILAPTP